MLKCSHLFENIFEPQYFFHTK